MSNNLTTFIQHLEMLAFFSGYPLIYYFLQLISRKLLSQNTRSVFASVLPRTYALVGTLFMVLQLVNMYPDFTIYNFEHRIQQPVLWIWAVLSLLFWVPPFSKKHSWTVIHSMAFFFLIIKDLFLYATAVTRDSDVIKNDMRVYTVSLFLNLTAFILLFLLRWLLGIRKRHPES